MMSATYRWTKDEAITVNYNFLNLSDVHMGLNILFSLLFYMLEHFYD